MDFFNSLLEPSSSATNMPSSPTKSRPRLQCSHGRWAKDQKARRASAVNMRGGPNAVPWKPKK
jgi:hypothetical protein